VQFVRKGWWKDRAQRRANPNRAKTWRRRMPSIVAGVTVPAVLATLAVANPGVTIAEVELNDGTVWITNTTDLKIGRYNAKVKELNGGVVTSGASFDVLQDESDVVAHEPATISRIDPATMSYSAVAQIPGQSKVALNAGIVAIADPTGRIWAAPVEALETINESTPVVADLSDGTALTIDSEGTIYAFDPGAGQVHTYALINGGFVEQETIALKDSGGMALAQDPADQPVLSVVGTTPVVTANRTLHTPSTSVSLSQYGGQPIVQTNGAPRGAVFVATDRGLISVNINTGAVTTLIDGVSGRPAQPVFLGNCVHAAWAASGPNYTVLCGEAAASTGSIEDVMSLENVSAMSNLVFRVNRDQIVLNDTLAGRIWLPENVPQSEDPNWNDVETPDDNKETPEDDDETDPEQSDTTQCSTSDRAPRARDDEFGVRADRATLLYVLSNDSVGQCGIIAITEVEDIPAEFGTVRRVDNGRALQAEILPSASGSVSFEYTITDGRGQNPPSTAKVTLTVTPEHVNDAPVELRQSRMEVEQGATTSYNVLANFVDPDGDQLVLADAKLEDGNGSLRFRKDGMVSYVADTQRVGMERATITVTDGERTLESELIIDVRSSGTLAPTITPIFRNAYVSSEIEVDVVSAVKNRSSEPVRLAAVDEVAGTEISVDLEAGTFTFMAPTPGSYYVNFTLVSPPHTVSGLARIDVREVPSDRLPPVAVSDVALLPGGGEVTVAPLDNDFDPNGGVMVLTGVELAPDSALSVGVIEHRFINISSRVSLTQPETIHYTVDNGYATAKGSILVQPVEPSTEQRPPSVKPITVSVRSGGVVTIPVLDYASDPDGDTLSLVRDLPSPLPESQGLLFVSGNVLRYQAPNTPRTTTTTFMIEDSAGQTAIGELTVNVHASNPETKTPPQPKRVTTRVYAGEAVRIPISLTGIDQDGDGVILLGQGDQLPTQGYVSNVGADWIEYTAYDTARGTDIFTYAVEDWTGQRAIGTIRVGVVEKPQAALPIVATDDEVTVKPGTTVAVRVTRNDVDPSGLALTVDELEEVAGVVARVVDNTIEVEVPQDAEPTYYIPYTVRNLAGGIGQATLRVNVSTEALILPPTVRDIIVSPVEAMDKTSVEVDVYAVAENPSGTPAELELTVPNSHADIAQVTGSGKVTVQLTETAQTVPFRLTNPEAPDQAFAYAFISVPALGDFPPVLRPKTRELVTSTAQEIQIPLAEFVQVGSGKTPIIRDASSVRSGQSDDSGLVVDSGTLRFVSERSFSGIASITFEVWDGTGETANSSILTLPITVRPIEELPPTFAPAVLQLPQGNEVVNVDLTRFTRAAAGMPEDTYSYAVAATPAYGVTAAIDGTVLSASAPAGATRGTRSEIAITLTYGLANKLNVTVPYEIVASTKQRPTVREHTITANAGQASQVNVLQGAIDPVGEGLRVVDVQVLTSGTGEATFNGPNVTITPESSFAGTMRVAYTVTDALNDPNRNVEGQVVVTVRKEPDAPTAPRVSNPGNKTVTVSWDAPNSNGAPVLDYRVTASPGGQTTVCQNTTCEISGLSNGTAYRFTVAARNEVGFSAESAPSSDITPDILPDAPSAPTVEFGDRQISVQWQAPRNEGSAIVRYLLEISPGIGSEGVSSRTVTGTSTTITGLKNGTAYTVRVRAVNSALAESGQGPWSPESERVIPAGVPEAPKVDVALPSDTPLGRQINVSWSPGSENGDSINRYTVRVMSGNTEVAVRRLEAAQTKWTFTEAENGVDYRFQVTARNKAGVSAPGVSDAISSFAVPSAPRALTSEVVADRNYAQGGAVKYLWDTPLETGGRGIRISHYEVRDTDTTTSGTSHTREGITPGQNSGEVSVRACNTRGVCSGWTKLAGQTALTKPQSPTVTRVSAQRYDSYEFTIAARNTGGTSNVSLEYRQGSGEWQPLNGTKVSGTITDFGTADSRDVSIDVRASNSQGNSTISSETMTVLKRRPPGAPQNPVLQANESWEGQLTGTWQKATERGLPIEKYGYCIVQVGSNQTCDSSSWTGGEVVEGEPLKTRDHWGEAGQTYELRVWAMVRDANGNWVSGPIAKATVVVPETTTDP
jgi:hypothetical protein